jgi:hypothetical protein
VRKHENPPEAETKRKAGAYPTVSDLPSLPYRRPESILKQVKASGRDTGFAETPGIHLIPPDLKGNPTGLTGPPRHNSGLAVLRQVGIFFAGQRWWGRLQMTSAMLARDL